MQPTGKVTIGDVARSAGVSVATVSKVINRRYGVAPATELRVQEVIAQLGYESSIVARSLRSRRTNVIGILVAEFEPFSTELLKGISEVVEGTGYELMAYSGGLGREDRVGWEQRSLSRLAGSLIDGAILVTPTVVTVHDTIPVVAVDPHTGPSGPHASPGPHAYPAGPHAYPASPPTIDSDNLAGARAATDHLLELGHRRIGFLGGRPDLESARLREQGYREALEDAGIGVDPTLMRIGGYKSDLADAPAHELLTLGERPTAIFAANDLSAIRTMEVAGQLGLRVPQDLSVVGFDNVPESAATNPPLTTVAQPIHQMGAEAVGMLVDLIKGGAREPHVRMPTKLIVRGSCRSLRK